jgi:hypothetical protein
VKRTQSLHHKAPRALQAVQASQMVTLHTVG